MGLFLSEYHKVLYKPSQTHSHKDYFTSRHWNTLEEFFEVTHETRADCRRLKFPKTTHILASPVSPCYWASVFDPLYLPAIKPAAAALCMIETLFDMARLLPVLFITALTFSWTGLYFFKHVQPIILLQVLCTSFVQQVLLKIFCLEIILSTSDFQVCQLFH